jgi:serine protease
LTFLFKKPIQIQPMKKIFTLFALLFSFSLFTFGGSNAPRSFRLAANLSDSDYVHGKVIFKIKPEYRSACDTRAVNIGSLQNTFASLQVSTVQKKFPLHQPPAQLRNERGQQLTDLSLIYELHYDASVTIEKAITLLLQDDAIEYAEPDYVQRLCYVPNDTLLVNQYQLINIHAFQGWDISKGDTNIVVGITDTGTDMDHPDLVNQIKYNYNDTIDGLDNDGDGYVDNFRGWDLGDSDNFPNIDAIIHGSFTSGCSSAQADNITGIAGSGFNCKYLPVKISSGSYLTKAYEGIVYAADHGCQVINCSWGSTGAGQYGQDIINYATINKNRLIVAAAGNNNNDDPFYPASYKYVLNVAASNANDEKWSGSSFGCTIDVSAPGQQVYSTISNDAYAPSSGTSFASPIVAGLAGIVMSHLNTLTPLQVAEQLRVTCDDIDTVALNAPYMHELGKGRVNLYRALTETGAQSVRMTDIAITDNNDNAFAANDTLRITGKITNWLNPVTNLTLTLTASSPDVTILNGTVTIPAMNTFDSTDNDSNPFTVVISPTIPRNAKVMFLITYSADGGYSDFQCFNQVLNVDYINVKINDIYTSITSRGRIGYNAPNQSQGIGVTYNEGPTTLYEASLLIGDTTTRVSDEMIDSPVSVNDTNFVAVDYVRQVIPSVISDFDLYSTFNDDGAGVNKLSVTVTQNTYAWSTPADAKYIMIVYGFKNEGTNPITNFYSGIYADWDIGAVTDNRAAQDAALKIGYAWENITNGTYVGVKVLGSAPFNCYAFDNDGSNGSYSIYDGFTKAEKYTSMSTSRASAGQGDVSVMVGSGPYTIAAGDSIRVGFAIIAADSLPMMQDAALAADDKFNHLSVQENTPVNFALNVFPNPSNGNAMVSFMLTKKEYVKIEVIDVAGRVVRTLVDWKMLPGNHLINIDGKSLSAGSYFVRLTTDENKELKKLVITK